MTINANICVDIIDIIGNLLFSPNIYFNNPYIKGAGIYPTRLYNI